MKQRIIPILDAGHGGLIDGKYTTPGKRSPVWTDGKVYYEGVGNRAIRKKLAQMLEDAGLDYHFTSVGGKDVDLDDRVDVVNSFCRMYGSDNCVLVSIHSNGFDKESAHGWSVYTTRGTTKSDKVATILSEEMKKQFPGEKYREDKRDGDVDKEANFYIIANTKCPAILSENFFHTNKRECRDILMTEEGQEKIARAHFNMIVRLQKEG